jgi:hypothetical protein
MEIDIFANARNVRFKDLLKICDEGFSKYGKPRQKGSHHIYKTPWKGNPRINLQETNDGMAKPYQVAQVRDAIEKLRSLKKNQDVEREGSSR